MKKSPFKNVGVDDIKYARKFVMPASGGIGVNMEKQLFNDHWQFAWKENGQEKPNEAQWKAVEIPHDWLIWNTKNLYQSGDGWYRKFFTATDVSFGADKRMYLRFDGVYMDTTVFLNGQEVYSWKYGYSTFTFDCTDFLKEGENELCVLVSHRAPNSRWYSGAGIYRNVWALVCPIVHIVPDSVYISPIRINGTKWNVRVQSEQNTKQDGFSVEHCVIDADGKQVAAALEGQDLMVSDPLLWDLDAPNLYQLKSTLYQGEKPVQVVESTFGFREIDFQPETGFYLNGKNVKMQGACQHHDLGSLGAAINEDALRRQLILLKKMGVNAIRTSHNMPAPEFMKLTDEMGILVCSEAFDMWQRSKTQYDYSRFFDDWAQRDVESWVKRDRNHPSLIMWSIGNEIYDTHADEKGQEITALLSEYVLQYDPYENARVTIGSNYMAWENARKCADIVKLAGYNYGEKLYEEQHAAHPDWLIYGSETGSVVQSRGIYHFPLRQSLLADDDEQCSSLGNSATSWGAKSTEACVFSDYNAPFSAGQFIWTGTDYIGEPTPYHTRNSYFGQIDTAGFEKDAFYIYQAGWTDYKDAPMVHVFPYWDFSKGQRVDVRVCSNAPAVELFYNGQSLGKKEIGLQKGALIADYQLIYEKGEIKAVAYDEKGNIIAEDIRKSFGNAVRLKLEADTNKLKADGKSLSFIAISAVDENNQPVENANNRVSVTVSGAGGLVGIDNGDSTDVDEYKGTSKRLFSGKLVAIVSSVFEEGDILVTVSSPGLPDEKISLSAKGKEIVKGQALTRMFCEPCEGIVENEIPVRKIELLNEGAFALGPDCKTAHIKAVRMPENATWTDLEWEVTDAAGIPSLISSIKAKGDNTELTVFGDGEVWLRCMTRNGGEKVKIISQLCFSVSGLGVPFLNPYGFISGGLYTDTNEELSNGNERGVATPRGVESYVAFRRVDFGSYGADTITLPLFSLTPEPFPLEIWEGIPGEEKSEKLSTVTYTSGSKWNTYIPETYVLPRRLKGVCTVSFVLNQKVHIKGFSFEKPEKGFSKHLAAEHDALYGDSFTRRDMFVENIGNNVTLRFENMDFTSEVPSRIRICGRSPLENNSIHLRFHTAEGETLLPLILEFSGAKEYTEREFDLSSIAPSVYATEFVFLPGSQFDFAWFTFLR